MKIKSLFLTVMASAAMLFGCTQEIDLGPAKLEVDTAQVTLTALESSQDVTFLATRDWMVTGTPDWMAVSPASGEASTGKQVVRLSVNANDGYNRKAELVFTIGFARSALLVTQEGPLGEKTEGNGSKEDPYTVAGVISYVQGLGADVNSPEKVYIKGKVSRGSFTADSYGNGTFYVSDDGSQTNEFYAYRVLYLGNAKFTANDTQINPGDDVVIYGNVVNYRGSTPETVQNSAFLYSLNGVNKGGDEGGSTETGEAKGTGTLDDPFNVAAAIAKAVETGTNETADMYYIKGKVATITEQFAAQFGNATFTLVDEGSDAVFTAYRVLYFGNQKWTEGGKTIAEGDEVILHAKIVNFRGNTPETVQGSSYVYSINGEGGGDEPTPPTPGEAQGTGTFDDPFNVAAAIAKAKETGETATADSYYIKGLVTGTPDLSSQYKNATIQLVDAEGGEVFTAFRIKGFGGADITGNEPIKAGDELVVFGQIVNYKGNTPETTQGGQLVLWNGQTSFGGDEPGPQPGTSYETDLYKIINLEDDAAANFEGLVAAVSTNSFVVTDCTTHVYVFKPANMAVIGDKVQVSGTKTTYGGVPEIASGAAVNVVSNDNAIPYPYPDDITDYFDRLANSFSKTEYITFTGTLAKNGNYYNVAVSGSNYVGSISNPVTSLGLDNLDGKEVKVTGFFVGISGSNTRYVNVVATEVKLVNEDNPDDPTGGNDDPTGGNDDPTGGNDDPADDGDFVSNLAWEPGSNAYTQTAVVNGEEEVEVLKLGTSSKYGDATLMSVTGAPFTKIEFYAISWNNAPVADLVFSTDGEEVTVTPLANSGLKNNPPYTLTVTADDKYEVEFETAVTSVSVKTSGGYRAVLFGINAE